MLKYNFKITFRNLLKDKTSFFISTTGLAFGMTCCMLILFHVRDELSYNSFNTKINQIYRINWISKNNDGASVFSYTPIPFSQSLSSKISGIKKVAKIYQRSGEMEVSS